MTRYANPYRPTIAPAITRRFRWSNVDLHLELGRRVADAIASENEPPVLHSRLSVVKERLWRARRFAPDGDPVLRCLHHVPLSVCPLCDQHERDRGACTCY